MRPRTASAGAGCTTARRAPDPTPRQDAATEARMVATILDLLAAGAVVVTEADVMRRGGFTQRELARHRDRAMAEARRRWVARHGEPQP
jgi:hypothetical protein